MTKTFIFRPISFLIIIFVVSLIIINGSGAFTTVIQLPSQTSVQSHNTELTIPHNMLSSSTNPFNLSYSTYFGGQNNIDPYNTAFTYNVSVGTQGIAVDNTGNIYVTGTTCSNTFPTTTNAYNRTYSGMCDAFVSKFNNIGQLVYSTYLGGKGEDDGFRVAADNNGNIYVTGVTCSSNFPTTSNAYQQFFSGGHYTDICGDIFVTKFNIAGQLVYSTYLGGNGADFSTGIALDVRGDIYITGSTSSSNFPLTTNAFNHTFGGLQDAFVSEFNSTGQLIYSTYIGGSSVEAGWSIAVNTNTKDIYITGETCSNNFPTTLNAYNRTYGDDKHFNNSLCGDAFVSEFNSIGQLMYSTYVGGSNGDDASSIGINTNNGNFYITGFTNSTDFPTTSNAYDYIYNESCKNSFCSHVFVTEFNSSGQMVYSTYLGGSGSESAASIAIDSTTGNIYVIGTTNSIDFPVTLNAFNHTYLGGLNDIFLSEFNSYGQLIYSTYLGGKGNDNGMDMAISAMTGNVYVAGLTNSTNFPVTSNAYQLTNPDTFAGSGFILKLCNESDNSCTITTNQQNNTTSINEPQLTVTPGYELLSVLGGLIFTTMVVARLYRYKKI